jgi:hypothetical protein
LVALSSCEILDELKKIGVYSHSDLLQYVKEYAEYYSLRHLQLETVAD